MTTAKFTYYRIFFKTGEHFTKGYKIPHTFETMIKYYVNFCMKNNIKSQEIERLYLFNNQSGKWE